MKSAVYAEVGQSSKTPEARFKLIFRAFLHPIRAQKRPCQRTCATSRVLRNANPLLGYEINDILSWIGTKKNPKQTQIPFAGNFMAILMQNGYFSVLPGAEWKMIKEWYPNRNQFVWNYVGMLRQPAESIPEEMGAKPQHLGSFFSSSRKRGILSVYFLSTGFPFF